MTDASGSRPPRAVTRRLVDVEPETVGWLWPGRIPLGKLTILDGDPGLGKSTIALDIVARLSRNRPMPDGSPCEVGLMAGSVLLTAEDGLADTIRPRLDAAGTDVRRVVALQLVEKESGDRRFPMVQDVAAIEEAIDQVDARLLVVDPLVAYLGADTNSYRDQDVRAALAALAALAEKRDVAVLAIRHLNKGTAGNPLYRGGGSIGLIAAARSGLLVAPDPDDPKGESRILASTKCNLAAKPESLSYALETAGGVVRIRWEGSSAHDAAALLAVPSGEERSVLEEAKDFLRRELQGGGVTAKALRQLAQQAGVSWRTVERAKRELGVEAKREGGFGGDGRWAWILPAKDRQNGWRPKAAGELAALGNVAERCDEPGGDGPYPRQPNGMADIGAPEGPEEAF